MWELFVEFDLLTVNYSMLVGYLFALLLPTAAVYFFHKNDRYVLTRNESVSICEKQKQILFYRRFICKGIQRFILLVRRKIASDDPDALSFLPVV
jgi:hypothetical protein